jgi:hypothetical protein
LPSVITPCGGGGGGGGIQFNTYPQDGTWFYLRTTGTSSPSNPGDGMFLISDTGITIETGQNGAGTGGFFISQYAWSFDLVLYTDKADSNINLSSSHNVAVDAASNVAVTANDTISLSTPDTVDIDANDLILTSARLFMAGLPAVNPGGTNRVWNDGGTLKIT